VRVINETKLPDDLVHRVLESSLSATKNLDVWPGSSWVGQNTTVRVQEGQMQGVATNNWLDGFGHYILMKWPINHRNRNSAYSFVEDFVVPGVFPDIENVMEIYGMCAHEFGHCLDMVANFDFEESPSCRTLAQYYKGTVPQEHEVRARDYERRVVFGLNSEQWKLLQELARACEAVGAPNKRKNGMAFPLLRSESFLERQIKRYWRWEV